MNVAKIRNIFEKVKSELKETKIYNGFGWCAYCSARLSEELTKERIEHSVLVGKQLTETREGKYCGDALSKLIKSIDDRDNLYHVIKINFVRRKHLPKFFGHAVVMVGDTIYDITSQQFQLPSYYSLKVFQRIWVKVNKATIVIDESNLENFKVEKINIIS